MAIRRFADPGSVGIYRTMFFNKTAKSEAPTGGGSQLGWHQDRWSTLDRCMTELPRVF
jgi:hypothetical protein